jgi:phenylalanyl-tRNA synthetase beta chain
VKPERVNALLGTRLAAAEMKKSLALLGFAVKGAAELRVSPPAHRQDVREEPDVAEEVGRLAGYDKIASRVRPAAQAPEPPTRERRLLLAARGYFTGLGFFEARNYGLISRQLREMLHGPGEGLVELDNPISLSGELLAPELSTHLLANVQTNLRRGAANVRLFETARVFHARDGRPYENLSLAWIASGAAGPEHWKHRARPLDIWDAKGWTKSLLLEWRAAGVRFAEIGSDAPFLHPAESQAIAADGRRIGFFGRLHPRAAAAWDVSADTFLAELDLTALGAGTFLEPQVSALPKHPAVLRDFSLVFPEDAAWSAVAHRLFQKHERVDNVELFDVFKDASLAPGKKSLAFRVWFRHPERSMTDAEVGEIQKAVLEDLKAQFHGELRT